MYIVVDSNQVKKLSPQVGSRFTGLTLSPRVIAEIFIRANPEPSLEWLRQFNFCLGLEITHVMEAVAPLRETEIEFFEPFVTSGNDHYDELMNGIKRPSTNHVAWAREVKQRDQEICSLLSKTAIKFRKHLRDLKPSGEIKSKLKFPKFKNMESALLLGTNTSSFFGELILTSILNGRSRKMGCSSYESLLESVMRNQYLSRWFKMNFYYILSISRAWEDEKYNFDPSPNGNDLTDITLALYAADGDIITTEDKKLINAISMIEPDGKVTTKAGRDIH